MKAGIRVLFGIIGSLAIINNSLLLVVIFRNRALLKTPYNRLVLSLAITDLITGKSPFSLNEKRKNIHLIKNYCFRMTY